MGLLREGSRYVFFSYLSVFLNTIRGIVLLTILSPVALGAYRLIFTYTAYFRYYNLGLNALAFYRAPPRKLEVIYAHLLQRINIALAIFFGALFTAGFAALLWDDLVLQAVPISLMLFGILIFTQIGETFLTIAKIKGRFDIINAYNLIFSVSSLLLMYALGFCYGLMGVVGGLAFSTLVATVYIWGTLRPVSRIKIGITRRRIRVLFFSGVANIIPGMLSVLFTTIEIWLINLKFGIAETGYYSVVMTLVNLILLVNTDSLVFLYSKRSQKIKREPWFIFRMTLISFTVLMVICILLVSLIPWAIALFFPSYGPAADIYKLCFWGIPFLAMKNLIVLHLSKNKPGRVSVVLGLLLLLKVGALSLISNENFYTAVAVLNVSFALSLISLFLYDHKRKPA